MSAVKYRVTILGVGYGQMGYVGTLPLVYDFLAHGVVWLSRDSIQVTFGQATWPIRNVRKLDKLLSDCWFPSMPPENLNQLLELGRRVREVRQLTAENEALKGELSKQRAVVRQIRDYLRHL